MPITITDCGIYTPFETPGAGYWLDTPDEEAYSGISPIFMVRPRAAVVAPTRAVMERFEKAISGHAAVTDVCIADYETEQQVTERIVNLLNTFAVDVVVVAPACSAISKSIELPWDDEIIPVEQVILESKPMSALTAVWTRSWLTKQRHFSLDGRAPL